MKHILIALTFIIPIGALASAGPGGVPISSHPDGPDGLLSGRLGSPIIHASDAGTHVKIYIPGFLIKAAAGMAGDEMPNEARNVLRFIKGVSIEVAEGTAFNTGFEREADRQLARYEKKKRYYTLVSVQSSDTDVHLTAKRKKNGTIRRLVVLVCSEDAYVHVKLQTRIKQRDLQKVLKNLDFDNMISEFGR